MPDAASGLPLGRGFFDRTVLAVARDLIGCRLQWGECAGRIVEVEAYAAVGDDACHTARRPASREFLRTKPPGTAYVYLNYGIHWLLNVLAGDGIVLFRAMEPLDGIGLMVERRGTRELRRLCAGPGRMGRALGLSLGDHGVNLAQGYFRGRVAGETVRLSEGPRIGISRAREFPWRFGEAGSPWVSVRFPGDPLLGPGGRPRGTIGA